MVVMYRMIAGYLTMLFIASALLITGCQGGSVRAEREKWQNPEFFAKHRAPMYNMFVENGGIAKKKNDMNRDERSAYSGLSREFSNSSTQYAHSMREGSNSQRAKKMKDTAIHVDSNASQSRDQGIMQNSGVVIDEEQIHALQSELKQEPLENGGERFISLKQIPQTTAR